MMKLSQNFVKVSFRTRIRFGMGLVIVLVAALGTLTSTYLQSHDQLKSMDSLGHYVALNLSQNSQLGILSEEQSNLEQPLNAAMSERQVLGACVYLASGKLIGYKKRQQYTLSDFETSQQLELIKSPSNLEVPIETKTTSGRHLRTYFAKVTIEKSSDDVFSVDAEQAEFSGFVRIDMSLDIFAAKKTAILYQNLLLMPVYIFIGLILSVLIERHISKPLKQLKTAASAVAEGDFSTKIDVESEDELGLLAETFNDMTKELSKTITDLNCANESLEKVNAELQDFTYIVSHDLQEPLRKVHSFGQFLLEDCFEQLSEDGRDYVNRMQKASVKMKNLIQDLLKLSRISTTEVLFTRVNINGVINSALDDLFVAVKESGAEVVVDQLPDVVGQETMLTQLFENLIGNALKYHDKDRSPKIEISSVRQNGLATFSVKDNGVGIEERFLDKIFGVFQRLHTTEYQGTGIGLALCKKIVRRHGGEIWAESAVGKGTMFYFTLEEYKG